MSEKCECVNVRKVVIVGCGFVGSASAFALMQSGLFSEMVLIDVDKDRAEGEAMDISHGASFAGPMKIYAGGYEDVGDAAIIVITAGANQKPNETRLDLVQKMQNNDRCCDTDKRTAVQGDFTHCLKSG